MNLRIPGPTPCRAEVLEAVSRPMMNYHGAEMAELLGGLVGKLKQYLETRYDVLLLTTTGTGGLEAACANTLSPGDDVLGLTAGVFGDRFCSVAEAFGARVRRLSFDWGRAIDPDAVRRALHENPSCRAVLVTHNETSTGITHPLESVSRVVREETDALLLVDAVSSLGAIPLPMEEWGADVVISGSQKAWGVPPGMALLCVSERGWEAAARAKMPRFFFDLGRYRTAMEGGTFPFTPALSVLYGLDVALDFMLRETAGGVQARHRRIAERARASLTSLGLELFAEERHASPTVTAFYCPSGVDEGELLEVLRSRYETVYARGQDRLKGKILRLGHLGWVQEPEIDDAVQALEKALGALRGSPPA